MGKDIVVGKNPNNLKEVISIPEENIKPLIYLYQGRSPTWLVNHIDDQLLLALSQKLSRMSVEWGIWSGAMNRATRERVKNKDPWSDKLELTFQYWQLVSQLLELHFKKKRWFGASKIKQKQRQIKEIRGLIL